MPAKLIDFNKGTITGKSGREYRIENTITVGRWSEFRYQESLFYFGSTAHDLFKQMKDVLSSFNDKIEIGKAIHQLYNITERIASLADKKPDTIMYLVACFLNYEGEDVSKYDVDDVKKKIEDWSEYAITGDGGFFLLATNLVPFFIDDYNETTRNILEKKEKTKEDLKKNQDLKKTSNLSGGKNRTS